MAEAIPGANPAANPQENEEESTLYPPANLKLIPAWCIGVGIGESIAEDFLAEEPGLLEETGLTEQEFKDSLGGLYSTLMKDMFKIKDAFEDENEPDDQMKCF